ncbi:MAG: PDZ domain-containing protein [Planctomycetales bacterium]|nr:PDZ domain-containing protein [Planctomycetales bacterium]
MIIPFHPDLFRPGRGALPRVAAILACLVTWAPPAQADFRDHIRVRRAFEPVVRTVRESTVRVLEDQRQVALGVVVDRQGLVITKDSQLKGDSLSCLASDGRRYAARIVARDQDLDLALLQCRLEGERPWQPVTWGTTPSPPVGSWLATADTTTLPLSVGIVSVAARPIPPQPGFLGVSLAETDAGPRINLILENSAAAAAGLKRDDLVQRINNRQIRKREEMIQLISSLRPGDRVQLQVQRAAQQLQIDATLGSRDLQGSSDDRWASMNAMGGPLSRRRAGFAAAIQHDTILQPHHCGGPLVDLDGQVVGLNIARAARTHCYALPASVVAAKVAQLKREARQE